MDLLFVNGLSLPHGVRYENPFSCGPLEEFFEDRSSVDLDGEDSVRFVDCYHSIHKFNFVDLSGSYDRCSHIYSLNQLLLKGKDGYFLLDNDSALANKNLVNSLRDALIGRPMDLSSKRIFEPSCSSEDLLYYLKQHDIFCSYMVPLRICESEYEMIFYVKSDDIYLLRRNDGTLAEFSRDEILQSKSLLSAISKSISVFIKNIDKFDEQSFFRCHINVRQYVDFTFDFIRSIGGGLVWIHYLDLCWGLSVAGETLYISCAKRYGDIAYVVWDGRRVSYKRNVSDGKAYRVVLSYHRRWRGLCFERDFSLCLEFFKGMMFEVYRTLVNRAISRSSVDTIIFDNHTDILFDFINSMLSRGSVPDGELLSLSFNLLGNLPQDNALPYSHVQNTLKIFPHLCMIASLSDEEKRLLSNVGETLAIALSFKMPLSVPVSRVLLVALLVFSSEELRASFDDITGSRKLKICRVLERSLGNNFLNDEYIKLFLGDAAYLSEGSLKNLYLQFRDVVEDGERLSKEHVINKLFKASACYLIDRYLKHLESLYCLTQGMLSFCDRLLDGSLAICDSPLLVDWHKSIDRDNYCEIIDSEFQTQDKIMSKVMNLVSGSIERVYIVDKYSSIRKALVDGNDPFCYLKNDQMRRKIRWIDNYLDVSPEYKNLSFVKFVLGNLSHTFQSWNSLSDGDGGFIKIFLEECRPTMVYPYHDVESGEANIYLSKGYFIEDGKGHYIPIQEDKISDYDPCRKAFISSLEKVIGVTPPCFEDIF